MATVWSRGELCSASVGQAAAASAGVAAGHRNGDRAVTSLVIRHALLQKTHQLFCVFGTENRPRPDLAARLVGLHLGEVQHELRLIGAHRLEVAVDALSSVVIHLDLKLARTDKILLFFVAHRTPKTPSNVSL